MLYLGVALFVGILLILLLIGAMAVEAIMDTRPAEGARPLASRDALHYCQGCGCRHRAANMEWTGHGTYRCAVCCRNKVLS